MNKLLFTGIYLLFVVCVLLVSAEHNLPLPPPPKPPALPYRTEVIVGDLSEGTYMKVIKASDGGVICYTTDPNAMPATNGAAGCILK
jgi:hypothetical protein